jgi:hypothetical protein
MAGPYLWLQLSGVGVRTPQKERLRISWTTLERHRPILDP